MVRVIFHQKCFFTNKKKNMKILLNSQQVSLTVGHFKYQMQLFLHERQKNFAQFNHFVFFHYLMFNFEKLTQILYEKKQTKQANYCIKYKLKSRKLIHKIYLFCRYISFIPVFISKDPKLFEEVVVSVTVSIVVVLFLVPEVEDCFGCVCVFVVDF